MKAIQFVYPYSCQRSLGLLLVSGSHELSLNILVEAVCGFCYCC